MRRIGLGALLALGLAAPAFAQQPVVIYEPTFVEQPPVAVTAQAYSAGQSEGGLITVSNMARKNGPGTGILQTVQVVDDAAQTGSITALLFSSNPSSSTITDGSTVTIAKADEAKLVVPPITLACSVPTGIGSGKPAVCSATNLALPFRVAGSTCSDGAGQCFNGYLVLMASAPRTQATASDLSVTLSGPED